jgi:GH24 family phage-related lysozyme (muramidase)
MAIASTLFSTDPGKILDFSSKRPADIFNESILPKVNSFLDLLGPDPGGLEARAQEREQQLERDLSVEEQMFDRGDEDFLSQMQQRNPLPAPGQDYSGLAPRTENYDAPISTERDVAPVAANLTDFVKHFEGYNPKAFGDYKQTSIGFGTRARKGETTISKEEAERRLAEELGGVRSRVVKAAQRYGYEFAPNELDALTSFAYNVGNINQLTDNGKRSKEEIAAKILEYNKAGGKVLRGLAKRRQAEHNLFTKGY